MIEKQEQPVARLGVKDGEIAYPHHIFDTDGHVHRKMADVNDENKRLMKVGNGLELALVEGEAKKIYPITQTFLPKNDIGTIVIEI